MNEPVLIKRSRTGSSTTRPKPLRRARGVEELIAGRPDRVVDAVSGEDLTSLTLAQIILESERDRRVVPATTFLHELIQHGETWQDFVKQSLEASLTGVVGTQREAEQVLREWSARAGWWPAAASERAPRADKPAKPGEDMDDLRAEVAALKARLRELETRLGERAFRGPRPKGTPPPARDWRRRVSCGQLAHPAHAGRERVLDLLARPLGQGSADARRCA